MNQLQDRLHRDLKPVSNILPLDVIASIGGAVYPDEGIEWQELIEIANKKMYSDKRGKNIHRSVHAANGEDNGHYKE